MGVVRSRVRVQYVNVESENLALEAAGTKKLVKSESSHSELRERSQEIKNESTKQHNII